MLRAYSADMRARVIARVESGASRREAAKHFDVSPSTAVKWVRCFRDTGQCAAEPCGGSTSPLEKHAKWLLALITKQPDLTLDEWSRPCASAKSRVAVPRCGGCSIAMGSASKKACGRRSRSERTWREHADAGSASNACLIRNGWCLSTRPPPIPKMARNWGRCRRGE
jgi:transposase-like protein